LAPESIRPPHATDARSDIYALGAVAYYLLAGSDVFTGQSVLEVCTQHLHQAPEPLSARGVTIPADLEALVLSCLSKDPGGRPQTAAELRRRLHACSVEPWDSDTAGAWWAEHQLALGDQGPESTGEAVTIVVDGAHRSTEERTR
jgi:serine/threonine protein kinase